MYNLKWKMYYLIMHKKVFRLDKKINRVVYDKVIYIALNTSTYKSKQIYYIH